MKIGILTYHRARNYGAFLQAYSLCEKLNSENFIEAEIIDFQMDLEVQHYSVKIKKSNIIHPIRFFHDSLNNIKQANIFNEALSDMKLASEHVVSDSIEEFVNTYRGQYDVIIAGSDEIWKTDRFRGFPTPYWLIGDLECSKFAYAVSGRSDYSSLSLEKQNILRKAVNDFEFIGVRDDITKCEIEKFLNGNKTIYLCCDPVFLIEHIPNVENGRKIIRQRFGIDLSKKIIGIMTDDRKLSKLIRKELISNEYELLSLNQWQPKCKDGSLLSPFEWVDVLSCLDLLLTSFFHAVCFASKLGVPMIAFGSKKRSSKVRGVIEQVNRKDDYVENINDLLHTGHFADIVKEKMNSSPTPYKTDEKMLSGYSCMVNQLRKIAYSQEEK